jgi:hypothetical protein
MTNIQKLALVVGVAGACLASPAFAQSYVASWGTGNVLPFEYGSNGTRLGPEKLYARRHAGINSYAAISPDDAQFHRNGHKSVRHFGHRR